MARQWKTEAPTDIQRDWCGSVLHRANYSSRPSTEMLQEASCPRTDGSEPPCKTCTLKTVAEKYSPSDVSFIWFIDEKVFTVATLNNPQNDRVYASAASREKEVTAERLLRTRPTFSKSVMVSVGVLKLGHTSLIFVDPSVKVDGAYYRDVLLTQQLLPAIWEISGEYFIFQQDGAPAQRARETICLLERATPAFISPDLWPPNSPDLNPVDYKIWGVMQQRLYRTTVHDVEELKRRLVAIWADMEQSVIDDAIDQWRKRLHACIRARGEHFKHAL